MRNTIRWTASTFGLVAMLALTQCGKKEETKKVTQNATPAVFVANVTLNASFIPVFPQVKGSTSTPAGADSGKMCMQVVRLTSDNSLALQVSAKSGAACPSTLVPASQVKFQLALTNHSTTPVSVSYYDLQETTSSGIVFGKIVVWGPTEYQLANLCGNVLGFDDLETNCYFDVTNGVITAIGLAS